MKAAATTQLPGPPDDRASDGSKVRIWRSRNAGGIAHREVASGQPSLAEVHRTVEEIRFVIGGQGEMWRSEDGESEIVQRSAGTLPVRKRTDSSLVRGSFRQLTGRSRHLAFAEMRVCPAGWAMEQEGSAVSRSGDRA